MVEQIEDPLVELLLQVFHRIGEYIQKTVEVVNLREVPLRPHSLAPPYAPGPTGESGCRGPAHLRVTPQRACPCWHAAWARAQARKVLPVPVAPWIRTT